jgi:membrane-bound lytic murein transglycosylase D
MISSHTKKQIYAGIMASSTCLLITCVLTLTSPTNIKAGVLTSPSIWPAMCRHFSLSVDASLEQETQRQIRWHRRHPGAMKDMTENAQLYLAYVFQQTREKSLPAEIALVPFVESNYDPFARSAKGAAGLWQIMPDMASAHGLEINDLKDDRRNVIKATHTALNHLLYLKRRLHGRWDYAIAAYNAGEGRVRQAIRASNKSGGKVPWTKFLPAETRRYLPKILALKAIIQHPKRYAINLPNIDVDTYFSNSPIHRTYAFSQISDICKIDSDLLHKLNAEWRGHIFTEDNKTIILPRSQSFSCKKKLSRIPMFSNRWARHKTKSTDTIKSLGTLYNTNPSTIAGINSLGNTKLCHRRVLMIPKNSQGIPPLSKDASLAAAIAATDLLGPTKISHIVQKKDTVHTISKQHDVKVGHIAYWNRLRYPYTLTTGRTLVIWKNVKANVRYTKYVVQPGDTLSQIARQHKTSVNRIMQVSNLKDPRKIRPYQVITIPK